MLKMASMMSAQAGGNTEDSDPNHLNNSHHSHHLNLNHHSLYNSTFVSPELVDPNTWDYYERHDSRSNTDAITSQSNSYTRPWEMDHPPKDTKVFEPFSKLPSFQSQFHAYGDTSLIPEPSLAQPVPVPISPSSASPGNGQLTQLTPINTLQTGLTALSTPSFHTLTAVNTRPYPLVPAPIQARDIPAINQQYLEERHIQLYQPISTFSPQNILTVIKKEPTSAISHYHQGHDLNGQHQQQQQQQQQHQQQQQQQQLQTTTPFDNAIMDNGYHSATQSTPVPTTTLKIGKVLNSPITRVDVRKKERRKIRASSLESSAESESSAMEIGDPGNPGQVDAVSSTANFKSPISSIGMGEGHDTPGDKQTKKKRKRCGECIGCQKKDNCGDCAPCRNDKSHQICKQRRCEKLTDKKLIYGADGQLVRTPDSRRGRGKGRNSTGGTRGRKSAAAAALLANNSLRTVVSPRQPQSKTSAISPAPAAAVPHPSPNTTTTAKTNALAIGAGNGVTSVGNQQQQQQTQVAQSAQSQQSAQQSQQQVAQVQTMKDQPQQPMAPMAFYPTWQADPSQGWQNQFIQQIPQNTPAITSLNSIEFQPQSYTYQPNGYVQTGIGFDPNYGRTYAAPVQRYEFQTQQITPINQVSLQSVSFAPTVTYAGQVSTAPAAPVVLSNSQQQQQQQNELSKTVSGNDMPGYPRVNSVPPRSLNCNGYSGEFGGNQSQSQSSSSNPSAHSQQMQPPAQTQQNHQQVVPQSPNRNLMNQHQRQVSQSPNHVPQSPSSHMQQQYPIQQSPNHNQQQQQQQQMIHNPHQGMHTPNPQQQQQQQQNHTASPSHTQMNQDWNWNNQQQQSASPDMFNQSDRVNLNTRLKTMILSKNDTKDMTGPGQIPTQANTPSGAASVSQQSQNQTGHFLSYSHHLRGDPMNANGSASGNQPGHQQLIPAGTALPEPLGGGGEAIWKPTGHTFKKPGSFQSPEQQQQPKLSSKSKNEIEKSINDPGGGGGLAVGHPEGHSNKHEKIPYHNGPTYHPEGMETNPGQIMIKQEPGLLSQTKMEGYERNYQNFIQYADYCQTQEQTQSYGQDYQQNYQNPNYYSSGYQQNFQNYSQNYQPNASSYNCPPQQQQSTKSSTSGRNHQSHHHQPHLLTDMDSKQTAVNYEKEIPVHTYPNPNASSLEHPSKDDENMEIDKITGYPFLGEGGPAAIKNVVGFSCCRQGGTRVPTSEHLKDGTCVGMQTKDEILLDDEEEEGAEGGDSKSSKSKDGGADKTEIPPEEVKVKQELTPLIDTSDRLEKGTKPEVPDCDCFPSDKNPPEPGSYYTHLGSASTLAELRKEIEDRVGISGRQLRIEKVVYTGKEGKTTQGCPLAKWIIRRADPEEKILCVVKKRQGHKCKAAFIVLCVVAWDGMPRLEADNAYKMLIGKLNKFGLPTTRRCATNENRTCACQGLDPETSGASYSFGCSWSMYYNGCKYARSKTVRKFRLSVKNEETEIEDHMNILATILSPLFQSIAPRSFDNQVKYEKEAPECRLGLKPGKPFSGVTACLDFCAHAHRDLHNMQDGCTVQVALLKPASRDGRPPDDEQYHVLPLYVMDSTDEFGSADGQKEKNRTGAVQALEKFPCEVRVRSTPLQPCRRHGKKRNGKETEDTAGALSEQTQQQQQPQQPTPPPVTKKEPSSKSSKSSKNKNQQHPPSNISTTPSTPSPRCQTPVTNNPSPAGSAFSTPPVNHPGAPNNNLMTSNSSLMNMATMIDTFTDAQLQSNQISSTVLDSPYSYDYQTGSYIDSRNYYGQWPPPPHPPPAAVTPNTHNQAPPMQHHETYNNFANPMSNHPATMNDIRVEVKSRGSEDNPDSTTIVNTSNLAEGKLIPAPATSLPEEGFVKPKPPPEYQYTQYPNNYQMYPPPPTYSPYDAYNNMNYNYGYHQPYSPYGMYPQQTPPPTPPPPSPNWNMYPPSTSSQHPPHPPTPHAMHHQQTYSPSPLPPANHPHHLQQQQQQQQQQTQMQQQQQQQQQQPLPMQQQKLPIQQQPPIEPVAPPTPKPEPIGEVTEINENIESFQDPQMGGVAIALGHGSVLIECAKHEMHATTALKRPNRLHPTRMTLIFYQHRNLNRPKHGIDEWEEKMRIKKINTEAAEAKAKEEANETKVKKEPMSDDEDESKHMDSAEPEKKKSNNGKAKKNSDTEHQMTKNEKLVLRTPTLTTTSWTTLFPMHPCVVTGPYQEGNSSPTSTTAAQQQAAAAAATTA